MCAFILVLLVSAQSLVIQAKKKIEEIANQEGMSGVPSGFHAVDELDPPHPQSGALKQMRHQFLNGR